MATICSHGLALVHRLAWLHGVRDRPRAARTPQSPVKGTVRAAATPAPVRQARAVAATGVAAMIDGGDRRPPRLRRAGDLSPGRPSLRTHRWAERMSNMTEHAGHSLICEGVPVAVEGRTGACLEGRARPTPASTGWWGAELSAATADCARSPDFPVLVVTRSNGQSPPTKPAPQPSASSSSTPRTRRRPCPRLQPRHRYQTPHRRRRNLEPLPHHPKRIWTDSQPATKARSRRPARLKRHG